MADATPHSGFGSSQRALLFLNEKQIRAVLDPLKAGGTSQNITDHSPQSPTDVSFAQERAARFNSGVGGTASKWATMAHDAAVAERKAGVPDNVIFMRAEQVGLARGPENTTHSQAEVVELAAHLAKQRQQQPRCTNGSNNLPPEHIPPTPSPWGRG